MKRLMAVVGFVLISSCQASPAEMSGADAIRELAPLFDAYTAGMVGGDAQAVTALYTSDAVEMVPGPIRPHSVIVTHYDEVIGAGNFLAFDFAPIDAWVQGDAAFSISEVDISYQVGGEPPSTFEYYSFMRIVREGEGWKIHRNLAGPRNAPTEG